MRSNARIKNNRSETCDVTMCFAVYTPPRRVFDPTVAQEERG
jgi:hypothetical protein